MNTLAVVSFHNLAPSPSLEAEARQEAAALDKVFDRIVSCRVTIEAPPQHHHKGPVYRVRVEVSVPGKHLVVSRAPADHAEHADAHLALRDAFRAARRQLEEHARQVRGEGKRHADVA
jgi:ribosome-associated translation inhibitor RaiA